MASSRNRRITKELSEIKSDRNAQLEIEHSDGDLTKLKARIYGPPGTAYEGGRFDVLVDIPTEYPFRPPKMKFSTKVWHPNISSQTGAICLDTLNSAWSPVLTIKSTLLSLQSLLESPEPKDPQDAVVAKMMLETPDLFYKTAHEWAVEHAGATPNSKWSAGVTAPSQKDPTAIDPARYRGYHPSLTEGFVSMGFEIDSIINTFVSMRLPTHQGRPWPLDEGLVADITTRLLDGRY